MAVKLSASLWLMNNEICQIIEDCRRKYYLKEGDRKKLEALRKEYYELTEDSYFIDNPKGFVKGSGVEIRGLTEQVGVSKDEDRNYTLFEELADILKKYWIQAGVYRRFGQVFEEMERIPKEDTKNAIEYANNIINFKRYGSLDQICWENERETDSRKSKFI